MLVRRACPAAVLRCAPSLHACVQKYKRYRSTEVPFTGEQEHRAHHNVPAAAEMLNSMCVLHMAGAAERATAGGFWGGHGPPTRTRSRFGLPKANLRPSLYAIASPPCPMQPPPILFACNSASHPAPRSDPKRIRQNRDHLSGYSFPFLGGFCGRRFRYTSEWRRRRNGFRRGAAAVGGKRSESDAPHLRHPAPWSPHPHPHSAVAEIFAHTEGGGAIWQLADAPRIIAFVSSCP